MRVRFHLLPLILLLLSGSLSFAQAPWAQPFFHDNNAFRAVDARLTTGTGVQWETGDLGLPAGNAISMDDQFAYVLDYTDAGTTTTTTDDVVRVRQFSAATGAAGWSSPALAVGNTITFGSTSAPTVDFAGNAVYLGSGDRMQKLDRATGQILWSTAINAGNTTAGLGAYEFINSAPAVGGHLVFAESYDMSFAGADKQTIAFNATTGAVAWSHADGGQGTGVPLYIADAPTSRVVTATNGGARCYNAATGALIWRSDTAPTSWTTFNYLFAPIVRSGNDLFVAGNSFGANGDLFCIDLATGSRKWAVANAPSTSNPPVVIGNRVYVLGGPFGAAQLGCYDVATGTQIYKVVVGSSNFSTFIAGVNGTIYHTDGTALNVIRTSDGAVLSRIPGDCGGGVAVNPFGGVLVHAVTGYAGFNAIGGLRAHGPVRAPSAVQNWALYGE